MVAPNTIESTNRKRGNSITDGDNESSHPVNYGHYCITRKLEKRFSNKEKFTDDNSKYDSLKNYWQSAERLIATCANRFFLGLAGKMLKSDDAISYIVTYLVEADSSFDPSFGLNISQYRALYANYGILHYLQLGCCRRNRQNTSLFTVMRKDEGGHDTLLVNLLRSKDLCPPDEIQQMELRESWSEFSIKPIPLREFDIAFEHLVYERPFSDIAVDFNISAVRVRQLHHKCLERIQKAEEVLSY